jgi:hypothetical protein
MDHSLSPQTTYDDSWIMNYLSRYQLPSQLPDNHPSRRESQTLPSRWSIETRDGHPSTVTIAPKPHGGIIRVERSEKRIEVGKVYQTEGTSDRVEIKEVICWVRHAVLFYGRYQDGRGEEALLIVRNERVHWSWWNTMAWYLSFPFLQSRSSFIGSPV